MTILTKNYGAAEKDSPLKSGIGRESAIILFVFAFAFRVIYILQSTDNPLFGVPVIDAKVYAEWAGRMAEGVWRWDHVGNYLPVYPAFLALQQIVFGSDPLIGKVIHALMGSLSAVLMAQTAARAWNRPVGLLTGYLQARFLSGSIDGESFERQMNRNAEWRAAGAYAIGLKHWLNGNIVAARVAFERCLRFDGKKTARPERIPQKWAWEDLNRLRLHP